MVVVNATLGPHSPLSFARRKSELRIADRKGHSTPPRMESDRGPLCCDASMAQVEVVAAGREHAVVSTATGEVYTWGGRELLIGRAGNSRVPEQALVRGGQSRSLPAFRPGGRGGGRSDTGPDRPTQAS
jgi:hypothetical protein